MASDQPAEILRPGEQPLDLPATPIAAQRPPIWRPSGSAAVSAMGSNHLDPQADQIPVQPIAVAGLVANHADGSLLGKAGIDGGFGKRDFLRACGRHVNGDWSAITVCHCNALRTLTPLGCADAPFGPYKAALDKTLGQIEFTVPQSLDGTNTYSISKSKISLSVSRCRACALSAAHLRILFNLEMELAKPRATLQHIFEMASSVLFPFLAAALQSLCSPLLQRSRERFCRGCHADRRGLRRPATLPQPRSGHSRRPT